MLKNQGRDLQKQKTLSDKRGFGIIEVLIALGMVGVASIALMDAMRGYTKSASEADRKGQIQSMINLLQSSLSSSGDCILNLKGAAGGNLVVSPATATTSASTDLGQPLAVRLKNDVHTVLTENLKTALFPKIIPARLRLRDLKVVSTGLYTARLTLTAAPTGGTDATVNQYIERTVMSLYMTLDAGFNLQACHAASNASDLQDLCANLSGVWDSNTLKCNFTPQTQCTSFGGTWANGVCTTNAAAECAKLQGTWDPSTGTGRCLTGTDPTKVCAALGGSMIGGVCAMNGASECAKLGGTWNGATCTMTANPATTCAQLGGSFSGGVCNLSKTCPTSPSGAQYSPDSVNSGSYSYTNRTGGQQGGYTTTITTYSCINGSWVETFSSSSYELGTGSAANDPIPALRLCRPG